MALLSFVESAPRAYRLKASNAAPPFSTSAGTSAEKVSDHMEKLPSVSNREPTDGELNPTTSSAGENELLGRAIGMIRSALEKAPQ
jgi:hypothetical protein